MEKKVMIYLETVLSSLYSAEQRIQEALPDIISTISSDQLLKVMKIYNRVTKYQIEKVEYIFSVLGKDASENATESISGPVQCGSNLIQDVRVGPTFDRSIKSRVEKVILSKIYTYTVLHSYANSINQHEISGILEYIIQNEKMVLRKLLDINIPVLDFEFPYHISNQ